jgi:hypothetical protein
VPLFQHSDGNGAGWTSGWAKRRNKLFERCLKVLRFRVKPHQGIEEAGFQRTAGHISLLVTGALAW